MFTRSMYLCVELPNNRYISEGSCSLICYGQRVDAGKVKGRTGGVPLVMGTKM